MIIALSVVIALILVRFQLSLGLIPFMNFLFLISLILLMMGGSLWVLQSGMFNGIIYSFKRVYERTDKVGEYASSIDRNDKFIGSYRFGITYPLLAAGGILFLGSYAGSLLMI